MGERLTILFFLCSLNLAFGQCPVVDFTLPANACLNQNIAISNLPSGTSDWDFCSGDLNNTPSANLQFTLPGVNGRPGIELAKDGTWYGFVTGTFSDILYRLEFGNGINNPPTNTQNLGNLGGKLNSPGAIRIFFHNNNWYGLIHNTSSAELVLLSFGNHLSNSITTSVLLSGVGSINTGMALARNGPDEWVCILSVPGNQLKIIRLINNLSPPTGADILTTAAIPSNSLLDVDLIKMCDQWYGFTSDLGGGGVNRLSFGTNLFQQPVIDLLTVLPINNGGRLRAMKEGENYFLVVTSLDGLLMKINMGSNLSVASPPVTNEGNFSSTLANSLGLAVVKENSVWTMMVVDQGTGKVSTVKYPNNCPVTVIDPNLTSPIIQYNQSGTMQVALKVTHLSGDESTKVKSITISASSAPDIDFSAQFQCSNNPVSFVSSNVSGNLLTYGWDFGDTGISTTANPVHVFTMAANYEVNLMVTASNGCDNFVRKNIQIYNAPVADFSMPTASPVCTNQNYLLSNSSIFDVASNPSWEWRVNGTLTSSLKDLSILFNSPTAQEIRLKALISGCSNEVIKTISSVTAGPAVDFSAIDNCVGNAVLFANSTAGAVSGYQWSFGDGSTSTLANTSHIYSTPSTYQVTLTANNAMGCQNFLTKQVTVYSLPQPDFSVSLPPFSCANSPTQFQNNTPAPTDNNITGWTWIFGDGGSSSQQIPVHTYVTASTYNTTLTATTNKGCIGTTNKSVVISPSPTADFTVGPSCLNLSTIFTDVSSGGVQSRLWQIASSTFSIPNPSYTFTGSGDYSATLTVTSSNGCISVKTKTVTVPVAPILNFTNSLPCSGKNMNFTDVTVSPQDVPVGWNWNFAGNSVIGNPASFTFSPEGTYNIKLTTTHASGCKYTLSKNVIVNPSPVAAFNATPDRGAAPLIIQFNNSSQQATSYLWKFYDKITATSTQTSPIYTFASLGDYSAELTASNAFGCSDVLTVPIKVLVPVIDLVMEDFSLTNDPITGKLKSVVTISNHSNIPVAMAEVALFLADKAVVNETLTLNLGPGQSTVSTLSFTLSASQFDFSYLCAEVLSDKDVQPDNNKLCLNLDQNEYVFQPYPNPSSGTLHIDWISPVSGTARLIIYDNMGKKSYAWETLTQSGLNQGVLEIAFLTAGIYYLTIETDGTKKSMRFFRE